MNYSNPKRWYNKFEDYISAAAIGVALILLFLQVIMRFVLKYSIPTLEEYSIYLFVWYTFLTSSDAMRVNTHIRVEAVVNLFGPKLKAVIYLITQILNFAFSAVFAYSGVAIVIARITLHSQSTTGFPMWIVWASIPICMILSSIRSLQYIYFTIKYDLMGKPLPDYIATDVIEIDGVVIAKEEAQENEENFKSSELGGETK